MKNAPRSSAPRKVALVIVALLALAFLFVWHIQRPVPGLTLAGVSTAPFDSEASLMRVQSGLDMVPQGALFARLDFDRAQEIALGWNGVRAFKHIWTGTNWMAQRVPHSGFFVPNTPVTEVFLPYNGEQKWKCEVVVQTYPFKRFWFINRFKIEKRLMSDELGPAPVGVRPKDIIPPKETWPVKP